MTSFLANTAATTPASGHCDIFHNVDPTHSHPATERESRAGRRSCGLEHGKACLGGSHVAMSVRTEGGTMGATPGADFCARKYATSPQNWQRHSSCHDQIAARKPVTQGNRPLMEKKGGRFGLWQIVFSVSNDSPRVSGKFRFRTVVRRFVTPAKMLTRSIIEPDSQPLPNPRKLHESLKFHLTDHFGSLFDLCGHDTDGLRPELVACEFIDCKSWRW